MDNDLISRSALIEWFSPYMHEDEAISPDVVIGDIKAAPSVDAVEIVRCKYCRYKGPIDRFGDLYCPILGVPMQNNDFCSYGERMGGHA